MLTDSGYYTGLAVYVTSGLLALALINLVFLRPVRWGTRCLVTLPLAALLLTPAYIAAGATTFAPALVVAAFQWLSAGPEAAEHALRPLALFFGVALAAGFLAFLLSMLLARGKGNDVGEAA